MTQVLKATVVAPYLLLAWAVYAGLLPITAFWGAALLSVLPGRSFVSFAQVSSMAHRLSDRTWSSAALYPVLAQHVFATSSLVYSSGCFVSLGEARMGLRITILRLSCGDDVCVRSKSILLGVPSAQDTHQEPELVKPLKRYAIKWHTALGLGLCAGLCLSPLS